MTNPVSLGIIADLNVHFYRCVAESAIRCSRQFEAVRFRIIERDLKSMLAYPDRPKLDGIFCQPLALADYEWLHREGLVIVNFSTRRPLGRLPPYVDNVVTDDYQIGALAATHFKSMGLRHFGFFGNNELHYCQARAAGFIEHLPAKSSCSYCDEGNLALETWLKSLPTPIGIFTGNDHYARNLVMMAESLGLSVPEQVAVIGVDGDIIRSELSPKLLTSVLPNAEALANKAVSQLLARIEKGNSSTPGVSFKMGPSGIQYGESAPMYHAANPCLAKALRWMEQHMAEQIEIEEIAKVAGQSRRGLEYQFKQHLDSSPYQKLLSMRMQRARELLMNSQKTIQAIAMDTGFSNQREFCVRFKQKQGITPSAFREQSQEPTLQDRLA